MKILLISREALFPNNGGHREYLLESMKGLAGYGNNIDVLSWGIEDDYEYKSGNIREYHYKSSNDKLTQNTNFKFLKKFASSIGIGQVNTIRHKGLDNGKGAIFLKNEYDLVLHNGPDSNTLADYFGDKLHIPKIERLDWVGLPYRSYHYKQWLHYIGESYHPYMYLYNFFDGYVTRLEANSTDKMDYVYTPTRKDMLKITPYLDKSKLNYIYPFLYNGCDISNIDTSLYQGKYILFYSTPSLNSYEAIKYIYKIASMNKRLQFIITGNFDNIKATYSRENLIFLGELPQNEFYKVLKNAYFVIFPLTLGHGIQMKLIRAFSFSKAVIANDGVLKPMEDIMQDHKNITIGETPSKFYEIIMYLYEDENFVNEIGKNAYMTYKQNFSPEVGIKKLNEYLNTCKQNYNTVN